jgi:hypothetical protein
MLIRLCSKLGLIQISEETLKRMSDAALKRTVIGIGEIIQDPSRNFVIQTPARGKITSKAVEIQVSVVVENPSLPAPWEGEPRDLTPRIKKPKRQERQERQEFYLSREWRAVRYKALQVSQGLCCLCGRGRKDGVILHVDHIKPRSLYPELELDVNNLQVLCADCNLGKSNRDETDWR